MGTRFHAVRVSQKGVTIKMRNYRHSHAGAWERGNTLNEGAKRWVLGLRPVGVPFGKPDLRQQRLQFVNSGNSQFLTNLLSFKSLRQKTSGIHGQYCF